MRRRWAVSDLHRLLDQFRVGDTLAVRKLDWLSPSLKVLLVILERIDAAGAKLRALTKSMRACGSAGSMVMHTRLFRRVQAWDDPPANPRGPATRANSGKGSGTQAEDHRKQRKEMFDAPESAEIPG